MSRTAAGMLVLALVLSTAAAFTQLRPLKAEALTDARTAQIRTTDFEEGYRLSLQLISMAGVIARADARQGVLNAQPNVPALRTGTTDWLYDRFLNRLPAPPAPPPAGPVRYWGAR